MSTFKNIIFLLVLVFLGDCSVLYQKAGEDLTIECHGVSSKSNVEWKFGDTRIVYIIGKTGSKLRGPSYQSNKYYPNTNTLRIARLDKSDSGSYSCSHGSEYTVRYTVRVVSVSVNPGTVLPLSSNAQLQCNVEGDPTEKVQWLRPANAQQQDERNQIIHLNSVTSNDEGQWTCRVQGLEIDITLTVVGLQTKEAIEVPQGGDVVLPCSLPQRTSRQVTGGKWEASQLPDVSSATLKNTGNTLNWMGPNTSRVIFTSAQLGINYDIKLIKVQPNDAGKFVCTVEFDDKSKLTATTVLKVVSGSSASGQEVVSSVNGKNPKSKGPWTKNVFGVKLWIWIAVGASSVVLIGLIILIVFVQRRNKHMKKRVRKLRSMRQPLTATDYCQCHRSEREVELVKQVRPVPVPRQQRNNRTNQYY